MSQPEIYLDAKRYETLVSAISEAATRKCPFTGRAGDHDQIRIALGEAADIWPESIANDLASNDGAHARKGYLDFTREQIAELDEILAELDRT